LHGRLRLLRGLLSGHARRTRAGQSRCARCGHRRSGRSRRRPSDNTVYKPNERFDIKWTIINDGTKTLRAGLDLRVSNGDKLMADTIVELPELKPGDQFQVSFDAVAPAREGTYVMVYMVEGALCYPYTAIKVEK
jgi:hypothetical protein